MLCVYAYKGGSLSSSDPLCAQGSHIVQEDAGTKADGWPFRLFPWVQRYSGNRNSASAERLRVDRVLFSVPH